MPISIAGSGAVTGASTLNGLTIPTDAIAPGLVLINRTDFTVASSVSVNNCFNSTYENYRVVIYNTHTVETPLLLRLRASGVDSSASYYSKLIYSRYDGTGVFGDAVRNNSDNLWAGTGGTSRGLVIDIERPALAADTWFQMVNGDNNAGSSGGGRHGAATAYDGVTFYVTSGTITGTLRIYGYRNA